MEKEELINLVRPNQILWKKSSSEFLQAGKKADLWIAIAQEYPDSVSGIKLVLFYNKGRIPPCFCSQRLSHKMARYERLLQ